MRKETDRLIWIAVLTAVILVPLYFTAEDHQLWGDFNVTAFHILTVSVFAAWFIRSDS